MIVPSAPSPLLPPSATMKLNAPYGASRNVGMVFVASAYRCGVARITSPLANAENHVLGRLGGRNSDQADESPVVEIVLCHRRAVAVHEVRLLRLLAYERSIAPEREQEV